MKNYIYLVLGSLIYVIIYLVFFQVIDGPAEILLSLLSSTLDLETWIEIINKTSLYALGISFVFYLVWYVFPFFLKFNKIQKSKKRGTFVVLLTTLLLSIAAFGYFELGIINLPIIIYVSFFCVIIFYISSLLGSNILLKYNVPGSQLIPKF